MGYPHFVDPRDGLTPRQRLAVDLLARGKTCREVARQLNVTERTIHKYRQKPAVMKAIVRHQEDLISESGSKNLDSVKDAVKALEDVINNPRARDVDKISAARALISGAAAYAERRVLERQIRDLERTIQELIGAEAPPPEDDTPVTYDDLDPLIARAKGVVDDFDEAGELLASAAVDDDEP